MDISVIIVSFNVRHFLKQCLNSVISASAGLRVEIFVIDNNSADGSCSMVASEFPAVKLIMNKENRGFATACNQGIERSSGKFILLLNPDTVLEEGTFSKCLSFMETHADAGATGVKMINGNGKLLPESKRALPTPATAFFKMTGLAWLFPKSAFFNRYYLGHLNSSETTEAEILSGAFMFIRKEALDKTGLLDEAFFMYGEDIDLSYRIVKAGFKNYYYPGVSIIHYKGESTKKSDINNLVQFYKAMIIFISKHFANNGLSKIINPLHIAVVFWGIMAVLKNLVKKTILPLIDTILILGIIIITVPFWENVKFAGSYSYPDSYSNTIAAVFTIINLISLWVSGSYKLPSGFGRTIRGLIAGNAIILIVYALLPAGLRFSRAIPLIAGGLSLLAIPLSRIVFSLVGNNIARNPFSRTRKTIIVSDSRSFAGITGMLGRIRKRVNIRGRVSLSENDLTPEVLGNIWQLAEIVRVNKVHEIIFSADCLSASQIISNMHQVSGQNVVMKIASPGDNLLIGSNSINL